MRPLIPAVVALLLALALVAPAARAQDASPAASPAAGPCEAPELPPGTPTPLEEATPAAQAQASPGVEEEDLVAAEEEAAPPAEPVGTPAAAADAEAATAALENLFNCLNAGDYLAVAALATDEFITGFLGVPTAYDVPATLEGAQPVTVRTIGNAQAYADGTVSVDVVYTGLFNGPSAIASERWFFVEEDGLLKLLGIQPAVVLTEGALPGAVVVEVRMIDFAFSLSEYTVPADTPVIFRTTNASATGSPHVNVVLTYGEGATQERLIEGEVDIEADSTGSFGALFLPPGTTGDLAFESLDAGAYFLICDVETEDGTPHFELGMVAQVTVE